MMNFNDECCKDHTTTAQTEHTQSAQTVHEHDLALCKENLAKSQEKYIYLQADFENFRRNITKERAQWTRSAQMKIFEDLVGIIDDFSLAIADFQKHLETQGNSISDAEKARFQGVELVYKNFLKFLEMHDITEVPTTGIFDPHMHEALMQVAVQGKEPGTIMAVLQKGYKYKDAVIRPAKVSVAQ